MEMKTIVVHGHRQTRGVDLNVNGRRRTVPVGVPTAIPADMVAALTDAGVDFTVAADDAPATTPAAPADVDLSVLDGTVSEVTAALDGLDAEALAALLKAERNGNTRKGVVEAIEKAQAALSE
jgi:hypothetical protein